MKNTPDEKLYTGEATVTITKKAPSLKAVDIDFLKSITGDDVAFEKELFILFLDSAKTNVAKMEKSLTETEGNNWYMASHALKGAAASIGAFDLSSLLEYAQTHPKDEDKEKIRVLTEIKTELVRVSQFINEFLNT